MIRSLLTMFLIWILTIQATLAFTPQASTNTTSETQKYINHAITTYNAFASNPSRMSLPSHFSSENSKAVNEYMDHHKINGSLPQAKFIRPNTYELSTKGKSIIVEIDPATGILRINGEILILNSAGGLKGQLEQVRKFLTVPKTSAISQTAELLFSLLIPSASADCLSKYNAAIVAHTPERKWYESLPAEWPLAIVVLAALFLPPVTANIIAGTITAALVGSIIEGTVHAEKYDQAQAERKKKEDALAELVAIRTAIAVAKDGKVLTEPDEQKRAYTRDELKFFSLYFKYSDIAKKSGGIPLSKEEFLKALVDADKEEKFCGQAVLETAEKVAEKITQQNPSLNPNEIVKMIVPTTEDKEATTIVDHRRDAPKMIDTGTGEQKNSPAANIEK